MPTKFFNFNGILKVKTYSAKPSEVNKKWWVIDASDLKLGRLASEVAKLLIGKHKPTYTPHIDCGDNVVIINAEKIHLTGKKADPRDGKLYYRHTGYAGGIKETSAGKILAGKYPERVVQMAVKRMVSRNKLGRKRMGNLYVYAGSEHPHSGQQPANLDIASQNRKNKK